MRAQLIQKTRSLVAQSNIAPPAVELDDYFVGNTQEDAIAPNLRKGAAHAAWRQSAGHRGFSDWSAWQAAASVR